MFKLNPFPQGNIFYKKKTKLIIIKAYIIIDWKFHITYWNTNAWNEHLLSQTWFYRLVAEFPATGGILTSWQFYSVKLLRYVSYYDYFIASCEITFCIFLFVFTTQEVKKIKEFKSAYFKSIWNWLELLLLLVSIYSCAWLKGITSEPTNEGGVKRQNLLFHPGLVLKIKSIKHKMN